MIRPNAIYRTDLLAQLQALHLAAFWTPSDNREYQRGHVLALLSVAESMGIRQEFWLFLKTVHRTDNFMQVISERGQDGKMS